MSNEQVTVTPFQEQVRPWLLACFGEMIAGDREERNHRFLEEALELVQSCGCTAHEAHQLVDYVYGRPVGDLHQEVGGVMVTLAALCLANDADMHAAGWVELDRIWGKVDAIRAKQAAKPKHSPLPQHVPTQSPSSDIEAERDRLREALAAKPWPPTDAELLEMLAMIVGAWWSKSTASEMRKSGFRPNVQDIKGMYAVRDALAPYVARAALKETPNVG
jgi:hypothetical protein